MAHRIGRKEDLAEALLRLIHDDLEAASREFRGAALELRGLDLHPIPRRGPGKVNRIEFPEARARGFKAKVGGCACLSHVFGSFGFGREVALAKVLEYYHKPPILGLDSDSDSQVFGRVVVQSGEAGSE